MLHANIVALTHDSSCAVRAGMDCGSCGLRKKNRSECRETHAVHRLGACLSAHRLGDEAIARLDHKHVVHAKHPIIDWTREYFAYQVDEHAAEFDNLEILTALFGVRKPGGRREIRRP